MKRVITLIIAMLFIGCASSQSSENEQLFKAIEQMEETNSSGIIYQRRQSHGIIGDFIHDVLPHPN